MSIITLHEMECGETLQFLAGKCVSKLFQPDRAKQM